MDRFEAMRTLVAAVEGGSLSAASRSLGLPLPTVSRRVSDLEALLGAQLLIRTSRRLLLTETGSAYVAAARRILDDLAEAEAVAAGEYSAPRGELLVTAPIHFGALHVAPVVHEFLGAFPEVTVRLALSDALLDLTEAQIDLAIRIGALPDSSLMARKVGSIRWLACAAPAYLARRGLPETPADLAAHDCIAFEGLELWRDWSFAGEGGPISVRIRPRYSVNTADAVIAGALAGLGIAYVTTYQAAERVREGSLVAVLADFAAQPVPVHLAHPPRQHQAKKLRAFMDFAAPRLQQRLAEIGAIFPFPAS